MAPRRTKKATRTVRRGSHADRRALTQTKVIDACLTTLAELGLEATTTTLVAKRADVSRGALLQQYPSRLEMILAAAEAGIRQRCAATAELIAQIPEGIDRYRAMGDNVLSHDRLPLRLALIELQLAARRDKDLAKGLRKRVYPLMRIEFQTAGKIAREAGFPDSTFADAQAQLTLASLWGLAVMGLMFRDTAPLAPVYQLLVENRERLLREVLGKPSSKETDSDITRSTRRTRSSE
jgi:AcrR family transcriptional regulator